MSFTEISEQIRIEDGKISIRALLFFGKEGVHYVVVSPSVLVSGYGETEKEALESFKHNLKVFGSDVLSVKAEERDLYLSSLGFQKEDKHDKNFSHVYVDSKGVLQEFDTPEIKTKMIEAEL
jgi:hypothetical protein